ncbi:hypothetical protein MHBO_000220 [Bonamia ostreae]|uniref:Protein FRA10AC1 n=1 Tax=Bonamia ostreae TaxID=126728 RepID=A0ABV2AFJ0_9EUKA
MSKKRKKVTEIDSVKKAYKFLRSDSDDTENEEGWEDRLAKKYEEKLFKEFALIDLKYYKLGKFGLRWRIKKEVLEGKGQFICGNKKCNKKKNLSSFEMNFKYKENNKKQSALVKVRLCKDCSEKLNYKK